MKKLVFPFLVSLLILTIFGCRGKMTFQEQIKNEVESKMGTGICDSIPANSIIKNVKIGKITPIGESGLIDVEIEFDFEINKQTRHKSGAVLYSKQEDTYYLEALGGCEYSRKKK